MQVRRILRRIALPVAVVATGVGIAVSLFGGFAVTLSGTTLLRSHDRLRPALVAVLTWAAFAAAGGTFEWPAAWDRTRRRRACHIVAAAMAASTLIVGVAFLTTAVGGADTYGYASQADVVARPRDRGPALGQRRAVANARATFTPLAYAPSYDVRRPWTCRRRIPPGFPG